MPLRVPPRHRPSRPRPHGSIHQDPGATVPALCLSAVATCVASVLPACGAPASAPSAPHHQPPAPITVHEDVIYDSPSTVITRVRDSSGRTIRYEKTRR